MSYSEVEYFFDNFHINEVNITFIYCFVMILFYAKKIFSKT